MRKIIFFLLLYFLISSCENNMARLYHTTVNYKLLNHSIKIPESYGYKKEFKNIFNKNKKTMFIFFESQHISSIASLVQWKELQEQNDVFKNVNFYYVFLGAENEYIENQVLSSNNNFPIIFDEKSEIIYDNNLEKFTSGVFLIGTDSKIKITGNPLNNKYLLNYYIKIINN